MFEALFFHQIRQKYPSTLNFWGNRVCEIENQFGFNLHLARCQSTQIQLHFELNGSDEERSTT